jgi:hypothetical protein
LENKEEKKGKRISGSLARVTKRRRKKNTKNISTEPIQKTEPWFTSLFYNFLYYRSEESPYSPTKEYPKVKLPRSRHK